MGSEKYPDENFFMEFINKHGGTTNAFTSDINTTYYFTINPDSLLEGLDIFSGFFINPLLKKDCVDREINAVNSEHSKNISDDGWSSRNIYKKLYTSTHPSKKFNTGSLATLKCDDIKTKLEHFYTTHYSSHHMNVVIVRNDSINMEQLKTNIYNTFGKIPKREIHINRSFGKILNGGEMVKYVPTSDIQTLTLLYEAPVFSKDKKKNPMYFICNVLGHEGENSIHRILSDKGWISSLYAGTLCSYDDKCVGCIDIKMSETGFSNVESIIQIIMDYIKMFSESVSTPECENIYKDMAKLHKLSFDNWTSSDIVSTMITISSELMDDVPPNEIFSYRAKTAEYSVIKPTVENILSNINIRNVSFALCSKLYCYTLGSKDANYNTEYIVYTRSETSELTNSKSYKLPPHNKYMCDTIDLILGEDSVYPEKIRNDTIEMFYNFNSSFKTPTTEIKLLIEFPLDILELKSYVTSILGINAKYSDSNSEIYQAQLADYTVFMGMNSNVLYVNITGYTSKISEVLKLIVDTLLNRPREIAFESAKTILREQCTNYIYDNLNSKIQSIIRKRLLFKYYSPPEYLKVLEDITLDDSYEMVKNMFRYSNVTVLINGNINKSDALKLSDELLRLNVIDKCSITIADRKNVAEIHGENINCTDSQNASNPDSCVSYMIDMFRLRSGITGDWNKLSAFGGLFSSIVSCKFFDDLRTKEQLGYIIMANTRYEGDPYYKNVFLEFYVQSPLKDTEYLVERIKRFIREFATKIDSLTDEEYKGYVDGITMLSEYLMSQIKERAYIYNKRDIIADTLKTLSKEEFIYMAYKYVFNNANVLISCIKK
jgi:insulysin